MKRLLKVSTHDTNFRESFVFSAEKTLTEYLCIEAKEELTYADISDRIKS